MDLYLAGLGVTPNKPLWKAFSFAIDWILWSPNGTEYNTFRRTDKRESLLFYPFTSGQPSNASFAFHVRYIQRKGSFSDICFVEQKYDQTFGYYRREWHYWRLSSDGTTQYRVESDLPEKIKVNYLEILDVSSSYSNDDKGNTLLDYVVLFQDQKTIVYCYLSDGVRNSIELDNFSILVILFQCTQEKLKLLIDCNPVPENVELKAENSDQGLTFALELLFLGVVVVLVILFVRKLID